MSLAPVAETKERNYDDWIAGFVEYASHGEAPLNFLFWTGISTIAGALRRKVWIPQQFFSWYPNFYIILVAPPGIVSKSTTVNIGMNLLREVPGIKFGADMTTWQRFVKGLGESREEFMVPATGELMPMCSVTISSDELGNFLDPKNREMVDLMVALWDGKQGSFKKQTKNSGDDDIINPWINFIGCTTPAWVADNIPQYMIGGGFVSRTIFIYGEEKRQLVPYIDEVVDERFADQKSKLVEDLIRISNLSGEFILSPRAREWGRDWYARHWGKFNRAETDQFANYKSRKQTHLHKLAMVLSAARDDSLVITDSLLENAEIILNAIEPDRDSILGRIGQSDLTRATAEICHVVKRYSKISKQQLYSQMVNTIDIKNFEVSLQSAIVAGRVTMRQEGNEIYVVSLS